MKVIKKETWKREVTCRDCSSVLEIEADDVFFADVGCGYGDDHEFVFLFKCAACKINNIIKQPLPDHVEELARKKYHKKEG